MSLSLPVSDDSLLARIASHLLLTLKGLTLEATVFASIFFMFASPPNLLGALC